MKLTIFTTRLDTIFGATYLVIAPEHPFLASITYDSEKIYVEDYFEKESRKSELERIDLQKDKSRVLTSSYARNAATDDAIHIWVADDVLGRNNYGSWTSCDFQNMIVEII